VVTAQVAVFVFLLQNVETRQENMATKSAGGNSGVVDG